MTFVWVAEPGAASSLYSLFSRGAVPDWVNSLLYSMLANSSGVGARPSTSSTFGSGVASAGAAVGSGCGSVGAGVAVLAGGLLRILLPALHATGRSSLRIPVVAYVLVLSFTGWSAMVTLLRGNWILLAAMLVAAGGGAFLLSDAALAINRFVRPLPGGRLFEHVTYHLAQFSMALGMALYLP